MPVVMDIDKAPVETFPDGRGKRVRLFDPSNFTKNIDLHINILYPGQPAKGDIHYHKTMENIYIILEGEGKIFNSKGEEFPVKAGQVVLFRPGEPPDDHEPYNTGSEPLRFIEIYAPPHPREAYLEMNGGQSKRDSVFVKKLESGRIKNS